eukprot:6931326-Pyramimonas_sp.AAC.1
MPRLIHAKPFSNVQPRAMSRIPMDFSSSLPGLAKPPREKNSRPLLGSRMNARGDARPEARPAPVQIS